VGRHGEREVHAHGDEEHGIWRVRERKIGGISDQYVEERAKVI
jgi:hypothetical protein